MAVLSTDVDLLSQIQTALEAGHLSQVDELLRALHSAEIANLLESLPPDLREQLWARVTPERDGEVLAHAEGDVRTSLILHMEPGEVAEATRYLDIDDAVDVLQHVPNNMVAHVLAAMNEQHRQRLSLVLSYPDDCAGGLMNTDVLTVRADVSLEVVFRYLRLHKELPDKTDMLLVVDRNNYYQGGLLLSRLLTHAPDALVADVMARDVEGITADTSDRAVARLFEERDWVSAPVVDRNGYLLGRITIDDVVDVIRENADHQLMSSAGLDEDDDMFAPALSTARYRALWLGINLATALLAAAVISLFEAALEQIVALAVLMPIVASMGGIAGSQTLTVMIRGMALGKVADANSLWLLRKELLVGFLNGLLWAAVVGVIAAVWFHSAAIGGIIGIALVINLVCAALAGTLVPLLLRRLHIDPALAGGVVLTTVTDVVGFFAFLGLATLLLL